MKYIIYKDEANNGVETPIIFPEEISHDVMHRSLGGILRLSNTAKGLNTSHHIKPVSAGFVCVLGDVSGLTVVCTGYSETMKLNSRGPEDDEVISEALRR